MLIDRRLARGPLRVRSLWDDSLTEELPQLILELRRRRFTRRAASGGVLAVAAVAAMGFFFPVEFSGWIEQPVVRQGVDASALATVESSDDPREKVLALHDGSRVLMADSAELTLRSESSTHVEALLDGGTARFEVARNPERVFEVIAGEVTVRVVGTKFEVQRRGERARVTVTEGAVRVSWAGGERLLSRGQGDWFPPEMEGEQTEARFEGDKRSGTVPHSARVAEPTQDWRKLAKEGAYSEAFTEMKSSKSAVRPTAADLMLAADVARLSRHPGEAAEYLQRVCKQFPGDPRAPLAAFTLGRVYVENLGQPNQAADAFALSRRLSPGGTLAADALAREIDARKRVGQTSRAQALAKEYLSSYPRGRHRAKLEELADPD